MQSLLVGQRIRLSVGGADSRHFHPITERRNLPQSDQSSTPQASASPPPGHSQPGTGTPVGSAGGGAAAEEDPGSTASLTKRVLQVHTGGPFASSGVVLPVPRSSGAGGGIHGSSGAERGLGSGPGLDWGLGVAVARAGGSGELGGAGQWVVARLWVSAAVC